MVWDLRDLEDPGYFGVFSAFRVLGFYVRIKDFKDLGSKGLRVFWV